MKQLLFLLLIIAPAIAFSQATTEREYVYLTVGIEDQISKGQDINRGYTLKTVDTATIADIHLSAIQVLRDDKTTAGIILVTNSLASFGSGKKFYVIPAANTKQQKSFGWKEFFASINSMTAGQKNSVLYYLASRFSYAESEKTK